MKAPVQIRQVTLLAIRDALTKSNFVVHEIAEEERAEKRSGMARDAQNAILKASRMINQDHP